MKPIREGGLLVAVEGIDGCGKTSVSGLIAQYCGERGIGCCYSKEPTGVGPGLKLRESAKAGRLTPEEELEMFLEDRRAHVERSISPALAQGYVVVLDRYYFSTMAYQGARGFDPKEIQRRNEEFAPVPDLLLLLDLAPAGGLERIRKRGDIPNDFETLEALQACKDIFDAIEAPYLRRINAEKSVGEVWADCREAFESVANL